MTYIHLKYISLIFKMIVFGIVFVYSRSKEAKMIRNKGFTVIEVMVVVVVIGVVTAITVGGFKITFDKSRLKQSGNEVVAFYQRTNRYATTDGWDYKIEIDRNNEFLRCMKDSPSATTKDSIGLRSELDLNFAGGKSPIVLTVNADGTVNDDDSIRQFKILDTETGRDSLLFYISPIGVMEVQ